MPSPLRALRPPKAAVLSLEVLAHADAPEPPHPTQFRTLVSHFLERFFTNEMASAEGDAKTRLVQVACAMGMPGAMLAIYLYTAYHLPHIVRSYWDQAGDHYFFVVYSLVAMGLLTIFEWDMFFPDLLDVFVLSSLPVRGGRLFRARVTAIFMLVVAALFDSNILALIVLPAATDPAHLLRFLAAHCLAVGASGIFGAGFFLALEGALLALLGDRLFRKMSLGLQGLSVMALLTTLFAAPAISGTLQSVLVSQSAFARWFPPFWFLGIEQRILDGPGTLAICETLARTALAATFMVTAIAALTYPLAWWRRTRGLVEGAVRRDHRRIAAVPAQSVLHAFFARTPGARAIWHFISQNLLRVPRYRMVLVMYGGAGAALVLATIARLSLAHGHLDLAFAPEGLRAAIPIVAFWTVAGLRSTFLAPADQRGRWIFRVILGKPGMTEIQAARRWVLVWTLLLTGATAVWVCMAEPAELHTTLFACGQVFVACAESVLFTDAFFLNVKIVPFTGTKSSSATNLALLLIPYVGFFPAIVAFTVGLEPVIEASYAHLGIAAAIAVVADVWLRYLHRARIADHLHQIDADEDEEEFPLRLGLRY